MPEKPPFKTNMTITTAAPTTAKAKAMNDALTKARDEAKVTYSGSFGATYRPSLHQQKHRR